MFFVVTPTHPFPASGDLVEYLPRSVQWDRKTLRLHGIQNWIDIRLAADEHNGVGRVTLDGCTQLVDDVLPSLPLLLSRQI